MSWTLRPNWQPQNQRRGRKRGIAQQSIKRGDKRPGKSVHTIRSSKFLDSKALSGWTVAQFSGASYSAPRLDTMNLHREARARKFTKSVGVLRTSSGD